MPTSVLTPAPDLDLSEYCADLGRQARAASRLLASVTGGQKNAWLLRAADALDAQLAAVLQANARDIEAASQHGLGGAQIDRLRLTPSRLHAAATGLREIAALPDPVGRVLDSNMRPNGLLVLK